MNDVTKKIDEMRLKRKWTVYKLAQEAELPAPTIRKWNRSEMYPSIPTLIQICGAFKITLADFFANGEMVELTEDKKKLIEEWSELSEAEQAAIKAIIKSFKEKR